MPDDPATVAARPMFVVQAHWSRHLHYDLRLEIGGVLVSWALPKGPSLDPTVRRLAIRTPDHPLDYGIFEGTIPEGQYGAGVVMVWEMGTYEPLRPAHVAEADWLARGYLRLLLRGHRLHGLWELMRYHPPEGRSDEEWFLLKLRDHHAGSGDAAPVDPRSVLSGRTREEIALGAVPNPSGEMPPANRPADARISA